MNDTEDGEIKMSDLKVGDIFYAKKHVGISWRFSGVVKYIVKKIGKRDLHCNVVMPDGTLKTTLQPPVQPVVEIFNVKKGRQTIYREDSSHIAECLKKLDHAKKVKECAEFIASIADHAEQWPAGLVETILAEKKENTANKALRGVSPTGRYV